MSGICYMIWQSPISTNTVIVVNVTTKFVQDAKHSQPRRVVTVLWHVISIERYIIFTEFVFCHASWWFGTVWFYPYPPGITVTLYWARGRLKSPASRLFAQSFIQAQVIQKNIKSLRHWSLWGEYTGGRWIPLTEGSNVENISIWWRHQGWL